MTEKQQVILWEALEKIDLTNNQIESIIDTLNGLDFVKNPNSDVLSFMKNFNQIHSLTPVVPSQQQMLFSLDLILEETSEIAEACGKNTMSLFGSHLVEKGQKLQELAEKSLQNDVNLTGVYDGLIDLGYVHGGAIHRFGMGSKYAEGFEEVHRSNMSKACESLEEAQDTSIEYSKNGVSCTIDTSKSDQGIWLVLRESDNKLLKSIEYSSAQLESILRA